jgi:molecular chaperone HscB
MHECPRCWAATATPLFCESCNALLAPRESPTPFQVLGVVPGYSLDLMALRKRLLGLSRRMHPDFYGTADAETRELAQRNTAELNAAFEILADDVRRADWIVSSLSGPSDAEERGLPQEFLSEALDWNEAIEEARGAPPEAAARDRLRALQGDLSSRRVTLMDALASALEPLPELRSPRLRDARRILNAVRYLDRALHEIAEVELAHAPTR